MEKMGIGAESGSEPGKTMAFGKSFPTGNTGQGQQETDGCQHIENASPASPAENLSPCHRSQHRRQTVNHHEGGIQGKKLSACFYIPGNGSGNDQPERAEKALQETEEKEHRRRRSLTGAVGSQSKNSHAHKDRNLPAETVGKGTAKELPQRHARHGHGESQLGQGWRNTKEFRQLGKSRKIHVRSQRRYGRHETQKDKKADFRYFHTNLQKIQRSRLPCKKSRPTLNSAERLILRMLRKRSSTVWSPRLLILSK